jgi:phosphatidylglycerol:prolipoprotein diacylglycerol transferase
MVAVGIPLAHAFGRIGCFSYGCCYGRPTNSWIGILFPPDSPAGILGTKVIPTQLVEASFLFVLFFILKFLNTHKKFNGQIISVYLISYGIFRFVIEFFRADPRGNVFFLSISQFISIILIGLGIFLWLRHAKKITLK